MAQKVRKNPPKNFSSYIDHEGYIAYRYVPGRAAFSGLEITTLPNHMMKLRYYSTTSFDAPGEEDWVDLFMFPKLLFDDVFRIVDKHFRDVPLEEYYINKIDVREKEDFMNALLNTERDLIEIEAKLRGVVKSKPPIWTIIENNENDFELTLNELKDLDEYRFDNDDIIDWIMQND
ncbi:MAG: hypothetical protein H7831_16215 [Magnetococcus sp. WYHC-3]